VLIHEHKYIICRSNTNTCRPYAYRYKEC